MIDRTPSPLNVKTSLPIDRLRQTVPRFLLRAPQIRRSVTFRPVETADELKAASRLVYAEYVKRGYLTPNTTGLKLSIFHALPQTTTFIAFHHRIGVIGTMTLIEDSLLGLPMDDAYKPELDALRQQGQHLAEASMLSFGTASDTRKGVSLFHTTQLVLTLELFKVMFDYLRGHTKITEMVACFNPRHQRLYDLLHLKHLGGLKPYSAVNGSPAVARHLNVAHTERLAEANPILKFFYTAIRPASYFSRKLQLSPEELGELFMRSSAVFASASRSELSHVQGCYPTYSLRSILHGARPSACAGIVLLQE